MFTEKLKLLEGDRNLGSHYENIHSNSDDEILLDEDKNDSNTGHQSAYTTVAYEAAGLGVGVASMVADLLLSHPFVVIRGQCQVHSSGSSLHLTPFSLIPIIRRYSQNHGFSFLWKGLGSVFIVKAICFATENLITEFVALPKEISKASSPKRIAGHLLLKVLSWAVAAPFYAASVVEIVQSELASDPPTLLSCLREGLFRLLHIPQFPFSVQTSSVRSSSRPFSTSVRGRSPSFATSRLIPIWYLVSPVVGLCVGHYIVRGLAHSIIASYLSSHEDIIEADAEMEFDLKGGMERNRYATPPPSRGGTAASNLRSSAFGHSCTSHQAITPDLSAVFYQRQEAALQTVYARYYSDLVTAVSANMVADIIVYPLETLVVRLCVQGTRTLVDNMDTGSMVVPVASYYGGLFDALHSALSDPTGFLSLYRGFGALIAQYTLQAGFLYAVRCIYEHLLYKFSPRPLSMTEQLGLQPEVRSTTPSGFTSYPAKY